MPSPYKEIPITFEKGLVTEIDESLLDIGQASALENWEPLANGGLRSRNRWGNISTTGLPTDYRVRGFSAIATAASNPRIVQVSATPNTEPGTPASSMSRTLNGITLGNTLVAIGTSAPDAITSFVGTGWTTIYNSDRLEVYVKEATGTSETATFTQSATDMLTVTLYELADVQATPNTNFDVSTGHGDSLNLSVTPDEISGIVILAYESVDDAGQDPNAKSTPGGWTRDNVSYADPNGRGYVFSKEYTTGAAITDTYSPGDVALSSGWMGAFDLAATGEVTFYIVMAIATATGYALYRIPREDVQSGTWELIDSVVVDDTSHFVTMSQGAGKLVWSAISMTQPRSITLITLAAVNVTDLANRAGRSTAYHKDRLFVAGASDTPSRVYFSDFGDPEQFTIATDFLDIGGDDGEAIEDMLSVEGLLLICKANRLYLVSGSGVESFFVNELSGGSSSLGRPAVRTPYGTIVAGPVDVWVVQGGGIDPLSRPLGDGYAITGKVSTGYAQDSAWILDSGTNTVYHVNLVTGAWSTEPVTEGENEPHILFSLQSRLYYGVEDSDTEVGGTRRLSDDRSYDELTGGTSFIAATGRVALLGPSVKYTPRWVFLQTRNRDTDQPNTLFVDIESDHGLSTKGYTVTDATQRNRIDIPGLHQGCEWIKLTFRTDSSAIAGAIDPERIVLGVDVEAPR